MQQPQGTENDALWTEVASATFGCIEESHSQQPPEKYVIKHKRSNTYFSYGHWTTDAAEAQAFRSGVIAMSVAEQCGLCNVELEQQSAAAPPHTIRWGANRWD